MGPARTDRQRVPRCLQGGPEGPSERTFYLSSAIANLASAFVKRQPLRVDDSEIGLDRSLLPTDRLWPDTDN